MENKFGQLSKLTLTAEKRRDKTILSDASFTAPFKVMHPFYEKPGVMSVMALTASAGIMAGDRQEFDITVKRGASMEFLSQAYDKIHRMEQGFAERTTNIVVEENAFLMYTPLPVIPFKDSDYRNTLNVRLADESSKLIYSEILTCGRIAYGEKFLYKKYKSLINIFQGEKLIYRDNSCYDPELLDMEGMGMYEGFTHLANLIFVNIEKNDSWISKVREILDKTDDIEGGVTRSLAGHVVIKILGKNADKLVTLLKSFTDMEED